MSDDIIARAEAALEGVIDGPWETGRLSDQAVAVFSVKEYATVVAARTTYRDAHFIAAARTLVPTLVAELKAARAELERVREDNSGRQGRMR